MRIKNLGFHLITCSLVILFVNCSSSKDYSIYSNSKNLFQENRSKIRVAFVGDMMFGRGVGAHMDTAGYDAPLRNVAFYLASFDLTTGNLESPISDFGTPMDKKYVFCAKSKCIKMLSDAGFDVLSIANNHAFDYGVRAFLNTIRGLKKAGIQTIGGGENLEKALTSAMFDFGKTRIGFLAFNDTKTNFLGEDKPTCAPAYEPIIFRSVKKTKRECDFLFVHIHWGEEYSEFPTDRQISLGRALIDSGANAIIGHHPHRWQGIEFYKNGMIAYSIGNFVFDQRDLDGNIGGVLEIELLGDSIIEVAVMPTENLTKTREVNLAKGSEYYLFLGILKEKLRCFSTEINDYGNLIVLSSMDYR